MARGERRRGTPRNVVNGICGRCVAQVDELTNRTRCTSLGKSVHEALHVLEIVADLQTCEYRLRAGDHLGFPCEAKDRNHSGAGQWGEGERCMCPSASDRLPQLAAAAAKVAAKQAAQHPSENLCVYAPLPLIDQSCDPLQKINMGSIA